MPTWNRRAFISAAIDCWLKQTYENRELIILDDGEDRVGELVPSDARVRYEITGRVSTGEKRNLCCEMAKGEIICHMDDDDWSAPDRIQDQVDRLTESGKPITGYSTLLFWDVTQKKAKLYKSSVRGYICGTSFCYLKSFWNEHRFKDQQVASDNAFVYPILTRVAASGEQSHMVARIHEGHTSKKSNIRQIVARELIPAAFWENEELRLA
jgi:glycosyltransferase involved in cell wall biosynthesis